MKKVTNYVMALLCVGSLAFSAGAFMKVNAAPATTSAPAGQPVDLTYAAEKALPAVVHIKYVQNHSASSETLATAAHASRECRPLRKKLQVRESSSVATDIS